MSKEGIPTERMAAFRATSSASGVEYDTQPCFLDIAVNGKNEFFPTRARKIPEVHFRESLSDAKSESHHSSSHKSLGSSPM